MEMLVLIIQVYSEGSGEPVHLLSLISAFAVHLHRVWNKVIVPNDRFAVPLGMHVFRVINAYEIITPIIFFVKMRHIRCFSSKYTSHSSAHLCLLW